MYTNWYRTLLQALIKLTYYKSCLCPSFFSKFLVGGRGQKSWKFANVLNGWSHLIFFIKAITKDRRPKKLFLIQILNRCMDIETLITDTWWNKYLIRPSYGPSYLQPHYDNNEYLKFLRHGYLLKIGNSQNPLKAICKSSPQIMTTL